MSISYEKTRVSLYFVRHGETDANKNGILQGQTINLSLNEKGKQDALLAGKAFRSRLCSLCLYSDLLRARETAEIIDAVSKEHSINVTVSAVSQPIEGADANIVSSNTDNINSPSDIPHLSCPELREVNYGVREGLSVELSYTEAHQAVALQRGVSAKELKDWAETDEEVKSRQIQLLKIIFDHVKSLQLSSSSSSLTATSADGPSSTQIISNDPLLRNTPMEVLLVSHGGFIRRFISNMCPAGNTTYPAGSLRKIHNGALSVVHVTYTKDGLVEECTLDEVYANYSTHLQPVLDKEIIFT